jgi:hypothetical protein
MTDRSALEDAIRVRDERIAELEGALRGADEALRLGVEKTTGSGLMITSDLFSARLKVCAALGIDWDRTRAQAAMKEA